MNTHTYKHILEQPRVRVVGLLALALLLLLFTSLSSVEIFFGLFVICVFWFDLDSRLAIGGALLGLALIPSLTLIEHATEPGSLFAWRQAVAVWTYYFLAIGVSKQLWDLLARKHASQSRPKQLSIFAPQVPDYSKKRRPW